MFRYQKYFSKKCCSIIGMIHVKGLPGTPEYKGCFKSIIDDAVRDARVYKDCGIDAILVENMHDLPYVRSKDLLPETTAVMTRVCTEIRKVIQNIPCGVQVLAGANKEAIAIAKASGFQFIRAEGYIFSHIADEGFMDATAGTLLRYRKQIDATDILVFADIKKKHSSHAITSDVTVSEMVKAAELFLADGVILTGAATGDPADVNEVTAARKVAKGPVLIGSGVSINNVQNYLSADAIIIGSHFKVNENWRNNVVADTVQKFMFKLRNLQLTQAS